KYVFTEEILAVYFLYVSGCRFFYITLHFCESVCRSRTSIYFDFIFESPYKMVFAAFRSSLVMFAFIYVKCSSDSDSKILKFINDHNADGYNFEFQTSNDITRKETGKIKLLGRDQPVVNVEGEYSFNLPNGVPLFVSYVADENGYRPKVEFGAVKKSSVTIGTRFKVDDTKRISSAALASLAGGGLGK
ncbi:unnamed protein product, partial [Phyllotreta striolata]